MSDDYKKKKEICKKDCEHETSGNQCCFVKCVTKNILIDGKLNVEALALFFKHRDNVNVTLSMAHCESLGEKNASNVLIKNYFCSRFTRSQRRRLVECLQISPKSAIASHSKFLPNVTLNRINQIVSTRKIKLKPAWQKS